jgi:tetratricopeptide (TPR) repeat protein
VVTLAELYREWWRQKLNRALLEATVGSNSARLFEDVDIDQALIPGEVPADAQRHGAWLYFGLRPGTPTVGDVRISFRAVYPTWISVVAQQQINRLTPYSVAGGEELVLINKGEHSAETLFESARESNGALTWGLRLGGTLLLGIGFALILGPLATVADVIPLLGSIIGLGAGFAAAILAVGLSLAVIALAWIWYRPVLGLSLLIGCGALAALLWWQGLQRVKASTGNRETILPEDLENRNKTAPPPPPGSPSFLTPVDAPPLIPPPRTAVDHLNEGIAHLRAEDLDAALAAFSSAIQKDAELGAAYYFRGLVQSHRREKGAAVKNLQIAARLGHGKAREALSARQIAW